AGFTKDEKRRKHLLNRALEHYRLVASKDLVTQAQKARVEQFKQLTVQAMRNRDFATNKRYQRLTEKETEKLAALEGREDQTLTAKLKSGEIFFQLGKADESRVIFNFLEKFIEKPETKVQVAYTRVMSYALQNIDDKGKNADLVKLLEEGYEKFIAAHPKHKIAENLAILVGSGFVESDPEKAIKYFKESREQYPEGRFRIEALTQEAAALAKLGRYDEALALYKQTLETNPTKEVAAAAEFGIATIYRETGKRDEAIESFKTIRDKYAGTGPAETAGFSIGQLLVEKGDHAGAIEEFENFIKTFPDNPNLPEAMFALAQAQLAAGKKEAGLATFKEIPVKFPDSEVAPFTFFQRAQVAQAAEDLDGVVTIMREFIKSYPESEQLFQAYDYISQIHAAQGKGAEAIAVYEEFTKTYPKHDAAPTALRKVAALWKASAESQGRYMAIKEEERPEWVKRMDNSIAASERVLNEYPESPDVALALQNILEVEKARRQAKLITDEDVEKYFQGLAEKFEDKPATRSKIIFTLASFTFEENKNKAIEQMAGVYDASQTYAPGDLDLYGQALIQEGKLDEAMKVYEKLAADYPIPPNTDPTKASRDIQEAQSMALFGSGKVFQEQDKLEEAKQRFDQLEKLYAWSPKMMEANYGIALGLHEQKNYEEALKRLTQVTRSNTAPAPLRANGMLLFGKIKEEQGDYQSAIDNYIKIASFYSGVPEAAAEGLLRGAQLLERQGKGEIPMPKPEKKAAPAKKK
ncbi:MAG: tetratricopeptide repeat protein, partial [Chthoniobacteraceae bacterium]